MKTCPECSGPLVTLSSIDSKLCGDCKQLHKWELQPGQPSLTSDRIGFVTKESRPVTQTQHTDVAG